MRSSLSCRVEGLNFNLMDVMLLHEIIGKNMGYKGKMIGGELAKKDVEGH